MGVLQKILESKRSELPALRRRRLPAPPQIRPMVDLRRQPGGPLNLICEIKFKSPSAGMLSRTLSPQQRAAAYEAGGAAMVSVLCDGPFFDGDYDHLQKARAGCRLPLLCKEFIIDEAQLDAAAAFGASAVLLIVRCLDEARLSTLISEAKKRSLVPLVEVFRAKEAQLALGCGADFIGVNSRDLDTLEMDTEEATRVLRSLPGHICAVHLSGVKTPADVSNIRSTRADAALIGEVLMKQEDPTELLRSLARVV